MTPTKIQAGDRIAQIPPCFLIFWKYVSLYLKSTNKRRGHFHAALNVKRRNLKGGHGFVPCAGCFGSGCLRQVPWAQATCVLRQRGSPKRMASVWHKKNARVTNRKPSKETCIWALPFAAREPDRARQRSQELTCLQFGMSRSQARRESVGAMSPVITGGDGGRQMRFWFFGFSTACMFVCLIYDILVDTHGCIHAHIHTCIYIYILTYICTAYISIC